MIKLKEMIAMVGRKRFFILAILLGLTALLLGLWLYVLVPKSDELLILRNSADAERMSLQLSIRELPDKYKKLVNDENRFETLKAHGLMEQQDRILARARLDALRTEAGLRGIGYDIAPQEKVEDAALQGQNKEIVKSEMRFTFKGLTDLEMRDFISKLEQNFNGVIVTKSVLFKRGQELNASSLASLIQRQPVDFVTGEAAFTWYSLIELPDAADGAIAAVPQAFGGTPQ